MRINCYCHCHCHNQLQGSFPTCRLRVRRRLKNMMKKCSCEKFCTWFRRWRGGSKFPRTRRGGFWGEWEQRREVRSSCNVVIVNMCLNTKKVSDETLLFFNRQVFVVWSSKTVLDVPCAISRLSIFPKVAGIIRSPCRGAGFNHYFFGVIR